jgi:hypothetical protein
MTARLSSISDIEWPNPLNSSEWSRALDAVGARRTAIDLLIQHRDNEATAARHRGRSVDRISLNKVRAFPNNG